MANLLHSLRVRLVLTFVAIVGMFSVVLGLGGVALREWQLRARFDEQLGGQAGRVAIGIRSHLNAPPDGSAGAAPDRWTPPLNEELYLQLMSPDGRIIGRSANLGGGRLPGPPQTPGDATSTFYSVPGDALKTAGRPPGSLRIVSTRLVGPGGEALTLRVGRSFDAVTESLAFLRALFWLVTCSSLLVAAAAGWIVTARALGRLDEVSQLARHITPQHLDRRLTLHRGDDEITRLAAEVNHMLGRLESSFRAQERFIANASHELQTPVAVLLSEAQLLTSAQPPPTDRDYRAFARSVEQEMRQLTRIMGSLLSVIRVESGDLHGAETIVSLNEVLLTAAQDCRAAADLRGVAIHLTLPDPDARPDPPVPPAPSDAAPPEPLVVGDPALLQVMVENLLRHGIRNSPPGRPVALTLELDRDQALVSVSDQGAPPPDEIMRAALDRTRPAPPDAAAADPRQAWGLELSVAGSIADLHNGAIGVRRGESGVTLFVWVPLADEPAGDA